MVRFRRSRGVEREQMKWFVSGTVVLIGSSVAASTVSSATGVRMLEDAGFWLSLAGIVSLPVAVGVAILRHRLYDIDVIINRVLVYGSLTVALGLVYVGSVASLQYAFRALSGQNSQLAVVASTLAIAALFGPLRGRIQDAVDRRFYRRRYDAAKALESLGAGLRDVTDQDALGDSVVGVVRRTMQPAHVSLWLREPDGKTPGKGES